MKFHYVIWLVSASISAAINFIWLDCLFKPSKVTLLNFNGDSLSMSTDSYRQYSTAWLLSETRKYNIFCLFSSLFVCFLVSLKKHGTAYQIVQHYNISIWIKQENPNTKFQQLLIWFDLKLNKGGTVKFPTGNFFHMWTESYRHAFQQLLIWFAAEERQ